MAEIRYLDTSVILRYFLDDDPPRSESARELLKRIDSGSELVTTCSIVLFEVIFTLQKSARLTRAEIRDAITFILDLDGFRFSQSHIFVAALELFVEKNIAFGDAFIAASMIEEGIQEVFSFDSHFERVPGIRRILPQTSN